MAASSSPALSSLHSAEVGLGETPVKGSISTRTSPQKAEEEEKDVQKRADYLGWEDYFMAVACLSAQRSKDPNTQVGACIVNEERKIVGIGYNGMPIGCPDDQLPWGKTSPDPLKVKYTYVCHAEMNAIMNKISADLKGCSIYVALFPCNECAKLIIQSGSPFITPMNNISADLKGCSIYVALFPCNECAKLIIQSGSRFITPMNKISADLKGCSIYVALFPCNECAKLIIQSGSRFITPMNKISADLKGCSIYYPTQRIQSGPNQPPLVLCSLRVRREMGMRGRRPASLLRPPPLFRHIPLRRLLIHPPGQQTPLAPPPPLLPRPVPLLSLTYPPRLIPLPAPPSSGACSDYCPASALDSSLDSTNLSFFTAPDTTVSTNFQTPPPPASPPPSPITDSPLEIQHLWTTPTNNNPPNSNNTSPTLPRSIQPNSSSPCLLSANINGFVSKKDHIALLLHSSTAFCIALQETKLGPKTDSRLTRLDGYRLFRKDRSSHGGGVAVAVADYIKGHPTICHKILPPGQLEAVAVRIRVPKLHLALTVVSIYLPPGLSAAVTATLREELTDFLADLGKPLQSLAVCGDTNLDLDAAEGRPLRLALEAFGLQALNPSPPTHRNRKIDWCFADGALQPSSLLPTLEKQTDGHCVIKSNLHLPHLRQARPEKRKVWLWDRAQWDAAHDTIIQSGLHQTSLANHTPNAALGLIHAALSAAQTAAVPSRLIPIPTSTAPPWLTPLCLQLATDAAIAHKQYKTARDAPAPSLADISSSRAAYRKASKAKKSAIRQAKLDFQSRTVRNAREEGRLWEVHDKLVGKNSRTIHSLTVDGSVISDKPAIATSLLHAFAAAFQPPSPPPSPPASLQTPIPPAQVPPDDLLLPSKTNNLLKHLQEKSATGPDNLPPRLLRKLNPTIAPILTQLYNLILTTQTIPDSWKQAWVAPIPKTPAATAPTQFRPISILDSLSKPLERHLLDLLKKHLGPPDKSQFGFQARSGTVDAVCRLLQLVEAKSSSTKGPAAVAILSVDVRRAFDQLPHKTILTALKNKACPQYLINLINNWLQDRTIHVRVGSASSARTPAPSGCPQGGILSPYLYALAVDSIFHLNLHPNSHILLYADDTLLVSNISTPQLEHYFHQDASTLQNFYSNIGLTINPTKSQLLITSQGPKPTLIRNPLTLDNSPVPQVQSLRYLGVELDRHLSFSHHWDKTSASAKRALSAIGHLVNWESSMLAYLVKERVIPVLLYSLTPCPPTTAASWNQVDGVLRYAAHRLCNRWDLHGQEILTEAGLPSARQLAATSILRMLYACVFQGRRFGAFLERGLSTTELPKRGGLRSQNNLPPPQIHNLILPLLQPRYERHTRHAPARFPAIWREAIAQLDPDHLTGPHSRKGFVNSITLTPTLLKLLG